MWSSDYSGNTKTRWFLGLCKDPMTIEISHDLSGNTNRQFLDLWNSLMLHIIGWYEIWLLHRIESNIMLAIYKKSPWYYIWIALSYIYTCRHIMNRHWLVLVNWPQPWTDVGRNRITNANIILAWKTLLTMIDQSTIWQAPLQHCCRCACPIVDWLSIIMGNE